MAKGAGPDLSGTPQTSNCKKRFNAQYMESWECQFLKHAKDAGINIKFAEVPRIVHPGARFQCLQCEAKFITLQKLALHRFRIHKYKIKARWFAPVTHCLWCLKQFHTRRRVISHLQYAGTGCLSMLEGTMEQLTNEEVQQLDEEDAARIREAKRRGMA